MRVGVTDRPAGQQRARLGQCRADRIRRLVDMRAGEQRHPFIERAVVAHRLRDRQVVGTAEVEVVIAMAGRDVDEAGAGVRRDEVGEQQRRILVVAAPAQRMRQHRTGQRLPLVDVQQVMRGDAGVLADLRQQRQRDQQLLADAGERALRHAIHMHQRVVELRPRGDGAVAGHGPGSRRPDHHRCADQFLGRGRQHRKPHPDRGGGMVVVLDLRLGQRGLLDRRPHHRPQPAIQRAVQQELADLVGDRRLGRQVHRGVAIGPGALDAQAAELARLHAHPVARVGAALGAEVEDRNAVLVLLLRAVLLLDLPLDRQAMAVPAGDVVRVKPGHLARAVDHVLQDLVQGGADVQVPVRVGRAVMQDEQRPAGSGLPQLAPQVHGVPAGEQSRLLLRQVAAHREAGLGQEDGIAVVARGGGCVVHGMSERPGPRWEWVRQGVPALEELPGR